MKRLIASLIVILLLSSCATVQPYERQFIGDAEMSMSNNKEFNNYIYSIREGATPASTGKSSGGCGCN